LIALKKEGETGMRKLNQYTRYLTILITILQGYGIAVAMEAQTSVAGAPAVIMANTALFRLTTVVSLLGGTFFVVWLGEQITARGVGNGTSLIIAAGIVAGIPAGFAKTFELSRVGQLSPALVVGILALIVALIFIVVMMEQAQRRIVMQYPKGQQGTRLILGNTSYFPLKINPTGVMPPIFASALMMLPITVLQFMSNSSTEMSETISVWMTRGSWLYLTLYGLCIAFFTFFYTGIVFNPTEAADNLKKNGGFIAGIRPGKSTAEYFDYVVTRLTVLGAFYLTTICVLPEVLISELSIPFYLGGTTLMIVVTVIMDTLTQIQSHLVAYQYESLIRKAQRKGRL
jgi:preprotein translocase subunit SecY